MNDIGWIGLGIMGQAMAWNVAKGGFSLRVFNRSPDKCLPFKEKGIPVDRAPGGLVAHSQVIVLMVTGPEALAEMIHALTQQDLSGRIVINASTVSVAATEAAAQAVSVAGGDFLDAPVSGSMIPAQNGQLVFLAGGETSVLDRCRPLLATMGKAVVHCGAVGDGTRMKLAVNLMLANMVHGLSETLVFAEKIGLKLTDVISALQSGVMAAPLLKMKGDSIIARDFSAHFPLDLVFKDLNLILEEAGRRGAVLPVTAIVRESFNSAMAHGLGREDIGAVVCAIEAMSGLDRR
ncbi:MAG: NAD(P)-dependent oxidoreductase [Magnetococcales bacterium]|nr:NAD(P)-dependent oxidoreductase [Magnetococcales bacterium]